MESTLYRHGKGWLYSLNPLTKLCFILFAGTVTYLGPDNYFVWAFLIILTLLLAQQAAILPFVLKILWKILLPLAVFMVVIHGLFNPENRTVLYSFGHVCFYTEGVLFSFMVLLRLCSILSASLLFVFSTHPADLIAAISKSGLPSSMVYVFGSPFVLLPLMKSRFQTIQAAQRSRGVDSEGSIIGRFTALFPMITPLVLGALAEMEQRAVALEVRSFGLQKKVTFLRNVADSPSQRLFRWMVICLFLFSIGFNVLR